MQDFAEFFERLAQLVPIHAERQVADVDGEGLPSVGRAGARLSALALLNGELVMMGGVALVVHLKTLAHLVMLMMSVVLLRVDTLVALARRIRAATGARPAPVEEAAATATTGRTVVMMVWPVVITAIIVEVPLTLQRREDVTLRILNTTLQVRSQLDTARIATYLLQVQLASVEHGLIEFLKRALSVLPSPEFHNSRKIDREVISKGMRH